MDWLLIYLIASTGAVAFMALIWSSRIGANLLIKIAALAIAVFGAIETAIRVVSA